MSVKGGQVGQAGTAGQAGQLGQLARSSPTRFVMNTLIVVVAVAGITASLRPHEHFTRVHDAMEDKDQGQEASEDMRSSGRMVGHVSEGCGAPELSGAEGTDGDHEDHESTTSTALANRLRTFVLVSH